MFSYTDIIINFREQQYPSIYIYFTIHENINVEYANI